MEGCTWIGFSGYFFIFLFFSLGVISAIFHLGYSIKVGIRYGWGFILNDKDFFLKTPKIAIITDICIIALGSYLFLYKIAFIILPPYWKCLMG